MAANITLQSQLRAHLSSKHLPPTTTWLTTFLSTTNPSIPIAALKQTVLFRVLASDITSSIQAAPEATFPPNILDANIASRTLNGPLSVQVLDVEDIGRSRWSQVEAIEAFDRGETTKGREVIRVVAGEEGLSDPHAESGGGPCKVLLQDARGVRVYGFELSPVDGINLGMSIGAKVVLKNVSVARGLLLLEPGSTTVVGGKIDALHKAWKEGRKERLKTAVGAVPTG